MKAVKWVPLLLLSLLFAAGCNTAEPLEKTEYVSFENVPQIPEEYSLFQKAWFDYPKLAKYNKIYVAPVTNRPDLENNFWNKDVKQQTADEEKAAYTEYQTYLCNAFKEAINADGRWQLVDKPGTGILKLQVYTVQIVPQNSFIGAFSNVTSFTPIGLIILPFKTAARTTWDIGSSAAIEGYLTDSDTREIMAAFADRKKGRVALFNSREFTSYSPLRQLADLWGKDFVRMLNNSDQKKLEKDEVFTWFQ
ncbi:DUF3313 domain-containing protein [Lentisphaerota bacterium ZTH]|nr:DUF3313 domain-containing protein [Lentisphaerota bacterium]WET05493.1 DUF3313 domain-containing protein [Lentisphaerota bacterium ZTH]